MCYSFVMAKAENKNDLGQLHPQSSEIPQGPEAMKIKAIELINKKYKLAAEVKANSYLVGFRPELELTSEAEVMQKFAVALGILTEEEIEKLQKNYWDNRSKIGIDIPDRFGD